VVRMSRFPRIVWVETSTVVVAPCLNRGATEARKIFDRDTGQTID
jgi:hypothetical protein